MFLKVEEVKYAKGFGWLNRDNHVEWERDYLRHCIDLTAHFQSAKSHLYLPLQGSSFLLNIHPKFMPSSILFFFFFGNWTISDMHWMAKGFCCGPPVRLREKRVAWLRKPSSFCLWKWDISTIDCPGVSLRAKPPVSWRLSGLLVIDKSFDVLQASMSCGDLAKGE